MKVSITTLFFAILVFSIGAYAEQDGQAMPSGKGQMMGLQMMNDGMMGNHSQEHSEKHAH